MSGPSAYCTPDDLAAYGGNARALANIPPEVQAAACAASSAFADSKFRARYQLPLISYDVSVTRAVAIHAYYDLMVIRGYNPAAGSDVNLRLRYEDTLKWFNDVERQAAHPNVVPTLSTSPVNLSAPNVTSQPPRGWSRNTNG